MYCTHLLLNESHKHKRYLAVIGAFDGLHLGHLEIFNRAKTMAKAEGLGLVIISFNPIPKHYFDHNHKFIHSLNEKILNFKNLAPDQIIIFNFDKDFQLMPYIKFHEELKNINISKILVGEDFHYGYMSKGDLNTLSKEFEVISIKHKMLNEEKISSMMIKKLLNDSNIEDINKLLFKPYFIYGDVIKGSQKSQAIGFPTINIHFSDFKELPKIGVYYGKCEYDKNIYDAVINVGYSPTVLLNNKKIRVEAHLLNFKKNIYGESVILEFHHFIREEKKFNSVKELKDQISKDIDGVKEKNK